jgi:phage shock protein PspC (stress-responsive transcriptional regulator)/uncharacterized integral membrane protein
MGKKLHRSNNDKKIAGVCSGLGEYFNVDPVIIRLLFILLLFAGGSAFLAYIILWILLPIKQNEFYSVRETENFHDASIGVENQIEAQRKNRTFLVAFGGILIFIGVMLLVNIFVPDFDFSYVFPVMIIALGAYLISISFERKEDLSVE